MSQTKSSTMPRSRMMKASRSPSTASTGREVAYTSSTLQCVRMDACLMVTMEIIYSIRIDRETTSKWQRPWLGNTS